MRVDLSKDPLFESNESPKRNFKLREIQKQKDLIGTLFRHKRHSDYQIVDPLVSELKEYGAQINFKQLNAPSKASENLKKFIVQQQKNLRCLRVSRENSVSSPRHFTRDLLADREDESESKVINIPRIQDLFKNQEQERLLHQNRELYNKLGELIINMDGSIERLRSYSLNPPRQPKANLNRSQNHKNFPQVSHHGQILDSLNQEEYQIGKYVEKRIKRSKDLIERLQRHKRDMTGHSSHAGRSSEVSILIIPQSVPLKIKRLEGVKQAQYNRKGMNLMLTPASSLLLELSDIHKGKDRKEKELKGMLRNSLQNRESILEEKSFFYEQPETCSDLSPSAQFRLRQVMKKKLKHRLELSKEQISNFTSYLLAVKEEYNILGQGILDVLKRVRETLLKGKVMKVSDLDEILADYPQEELVKPCNARICTKLTQMMI